MTIAEQLTQTMEPLLDAVYAAGKAAGGGGGGGKRREYSGTIDGEVKGSYAYATLAKNDFLAEIRNLDTLFVRVECDIDIDPNDPPKYTIVKTWASNVNGELIPTTGNQLVYRLDSGGNRSLANILRPLYQDPATVSVGQLHIAEDGELRLYSASLSYAIRPCTYKVIVEW